MPMERERYPVNWERIATEKKAAAGWKCEKCGKQCRRPGEPFDTHRRTLTVAHLNHTPEDVRPENLMAMCAPCHLRYDAQHHAETRRRKKVIQGLWCCKTYNCTECPYVKVNGCIPRLHDDAIALLKEHEKPDCEHAEHDGIGCLGYTGCTQDDEPIDVCKTCRKYTGNRYEEVFGDG